jgi:signal peptidase II
MSTGAVTDFLDVHWRGLHWPAFNLADVFIVMAVIGWGVLSLQPSFTKTRSEP